MFVNAYEALAVAYAALPVIRAVFACAKLATAMSYARLAFSKALLAEDAPAPEEY